MSNHPVGIATMAALFGAVCALLLIAAVAITLHLDRRRHTAVTRARAESPSALGTQRQSVRDLHVAGRHPRR